jgi:hypothetical protein
MRAIIYILIVLLIPTLSLAFAFSNGMASSDSQNATDRLSPSDTIKESQIKLYEDLEKKENFLELRLPQGAVWTEYTATKSMDPVFDKGANGIEIPVTSESQLKEGDIVSYKSSWNETLIVHRIIKIGEDEKGKYYTLKGDNNETADPGKIRIGDIKYKLVAIIY